MLDSRQSETVDMVTYLPKKERSMRTGTHITALAASFPAGLQMTQQRQSY